MAKILIIEDEKFLRGLISRKLTAGGFEVIESIDGEDGLEKSKNEKPDLILLDLILPGINGFDVLAKIKEEPLTASIRVIILSNLGQREEIKKGLALGAVDYLVKAYFTPDQIMEKIQKVLNK
ncbi:MAG: response regulator [bacterium]